MNKVNIKPLSINKAWQGKRFKTRNYKLYEEELFLILPNINIDNNKKLKIYFIVGYSNKLSDIDNFLKPFIDIMQKKYNFNDRNIYELNIKKEIVEKGHEFVKFYIEEIT